LIVNHDGFATVLKHVSFKDGKLVGLRQMAVEAKVLAQELVQFWARSVVCDLMRLNILHL